MRVLATPFRLLLPLVASGILIDDGVPGRRPSAIEPTPVPPDASDLAPKRRHQPDHARLKAAQCESKFDCREGDTCYPDGQCRSLGKPYKKPKPKSHARPGAPVHKASPVSGKIPKPGSLHDHSHGGSGDEEARNDLGPGAPVHKASPSSGKIPKPGSLYDHSHGGSGDEEARNDLDINEPTEKPDNSYEYSEGSPPRRSDNGKAGGADIFDGIQKAMELEDMPA